MTFHLGPHVISGMINNTIPGKITGELLIDGILEPITLDLNGNAMKDIAGCVLHIENHNSIPIDIAEANLLLAKQTGNAGKFTASRKMNLDREDPDVDFPFDPSFDDPDYFSVMNVTDFVWYDSRLCRIILRGANYKVSCSAPNWQISPEQLDQQIYQSEAADNIYQTLCYDAIEEEAAYPDDDSFEGDDDFYDSDDDYPF